MKRKVYAIYWEDTQNSGGWEDVEAAKLHKAAQCVTVGLLVRRDKKYTRIAMGYIPAPGEDDHATFGGIEVIPNGVIKKRCVIGEVEV